MTSDEDCLRKADYAEEQARSAKFDMERDTWLRIAQGWLALLRRRPQSDEEAFNAQSAAKGTGQIDSESSH
jgi:hypothetical protein